MFKRNAHSFNIKLLSKVQSLPLFFFAIALFGGVQSIVASADSSAEMLQTTKTSFNTKNPTMISNLKSDETLIFFRSDAYLSTKDNMWHIPIHGWVYERENSWFQKNLFTKILQYKYDLTIEEDSSSIFNQRAGLLLADNERNKSIIITVGDKAFSLAKSEANGHFNDEIILSENEVKKFSAENRITYTAVLPQNDKRKFFGSSQLIEPEGLSVISDIDDTVKITGVGKNKTLLESTFYQPFEPVPGMAQVYQYWQSKGASFHFVSSSPWQLYSELLSFTESQGFPWSSFYLKNIRFKDATIFNLFKSGLETKPSQIEVLLEQYPKRKFILVGDSGEQDPEAYTLMYERYPKLIAGIYIRNVTGANLTDLRFAALLQRLPANTLHLFSSPMEIQHAI